MIRLRELKLSFWTCGQSLKIYTMSLAWKESRLFESLLIVSKKRKIHNSNFSSSNSPNKKKGTGKAHGDRSPQSEESPRSPIRFKWAGQNLLPWRHPIRVNQTGQGWHGGADQRTCHLRAAEVSLHAYFINKQDNSKDSDEDKDKDCQETPHPW